MNYSEMSDFEINKAAALAAGYQLRSDFQSLLDEFAPGCVNVIIDGSQSTFDPCNSWADAGPIIDENNITIVNDNPGRRYAVNSVSGYNDGASNCKMAADESGLRAAMIVFLMMQESKNDA